MATTVASLIVGVKDLNPRLRSSQDARILRWLNHQRRMLLNEVGMALADDLALRGSTYDLVADEPLVPVPTDFVDIQTVMRLGSEGTYVPSSRAGRETFRQWDADEISYGTDDFYHALRDLFIVLRPIPTANLAVGLKMDYHYSRSDWEAGGSIQSHWEPWREILEVGAVLHSDFRNFDTRMNLERQHDFRLMPQFKRRFRMRTTERRAMKDLRHTASMSSKTQRRFGRVS